MYRFRDRGIVRADGESIHLFGFLSIGSIVADPQRPRSAEDAVTTLPGRQEALEWLNRHLLQPKPTPLLLLALELDRLPWITNTFGVEQVDCLLLTFSRLLRHTIPEPCSIARLQGERFLVIFSLSPQEDTIKLRHEARSLSRQFRLKLKLHLEREIDIAINPTFSAGASIFPLHGHCAYPADTTTPVNLLHEVETALFDARQHGIDSERFYLPEFSQNIQARRDLESRMVLAIQSQHFSLFYQPIVRRDGRIIAAEALMRWQQDDGTFVPPDQFIPLAEKNVQILALGSWLVEEACNQLAAWRDRDLSLDYLSINVSPAQLKSGEISFRQHLSQALQRHHIPATML